jgi:hypothetical protein
MFGFDKITKNAKEKAGEKMKASKPNLGHKFWNYQT